MQIQVKRIYEEPSDDDGQRILVDRLWPRGVSKEKAALTLWLKDIAPSNELRQWFHHDAAQFEEFERRYRKELEANPEAVQQLRDIIAKGKTTLLYAAHDEEHNQARFLAGYMVENKGK